MSKTVDYDIIVVGAGPAGSTAAKYAAEKGVSVLLLEKDREIGTPVRCAEGISARSLHQFVEPDPRWVAKEIRGARLVAPDGNFVDIIDQDLGYVLERRLFDRYLAQLAAEAGADVRTNSEVNGLLFDENNKVAGVQVKNGAGQQDIRAHVVIGCDGVESRIGTWAGLKTVIKMKEMESCYQYTAANLDIDENLCIFYVGSNYAPGGYAWVFPKGRGVANVGLGVNCIRKDRQPAKVVLDDFMETYYPQARILSATCGGVPVALFMDKMVTDGLILAGDAAHQVNTMTGGGIASGMFGGREAGQVAAEAVMAGDTSEKRLSEYHKRWEKVHGKRLRRYDRIANAVEKMDDSVFNRTCAALQNQNLAEISLGTVFKTALMNQPKLLVDIVKIFFQKSYD